MAQRWAHERYCDAVEAEAAGFAAAVRDADPGIQVPTCPGWTVADLVLHLGRVHRWAAGLVERLAPRSLKTRELGITFPADRTDPAGYLPWFTEGAELLLTALRAADPDAGMWAWGADQHVRFWSRRQLHETVIHRSDAEIAVGKEPVLDEQVAVDGIDELLEILPGAASFSPNVERLHGSGETIALTAAGSAAHWQITLEDGGFSWWRTDGPVPSTATVQGLAADLDLFLWGRRKMGDPRLELGGDEALLIWWIENSAV